MTATVPVRFIAISCETTLCESLRRVCSSLIARASYSGGVRDVFFGVGLGLESGDVGSEEGGGGGGCGVGRGGTGIGRLDGSWYGGINGDIAAGGLSVGASGDEGDEGVLCIGLVG